MSRVIPKADDWVIQVMVVTKNAHGRGLKIQAAGFGSGLGHPARGEDAQYFHMGEEQHVAFERAHPCNDTIRTRAHVWQRVPAGATVLEQIPARTLSPNV